MTDQINVRLPDNLLKEAKKYAKDFGFSNIQELIKESLRERIYDGPSIEYLKKLKKESEQSKKLYTRKDLGF